MIQIHYLLAVLTTMVGHCHYSQTDAAREN